MVRYLSSLGFALLAFSSVATAQPFTTEFSKGEITIDSIKRTSDETVLLKGSVKNTSSEHLSLESVKVADEHYRFRVSLQDLKSKKQFERASVNDVPVASNHYAQSIPPGGKALIWARITAPPKDVTAVSVNLGGDSIPIDGVPITE